MGRSAFKILMKTGARRFGLSKERCDGDCNLIWSKATEIILFRSSSAVSRHADALVLNHYPKPRSNLSYASIKIKEY